MEINTQNRPFDTKHCIHFAITIPMTEDDALNILESTEWQVVVKTHPKGFRLIELWIENQLMIELIPKDEVQKAISSLNSKNYS